MKRNRGGERDLDHIILAAIRGLDRASLEYPQVRAGLILMMDRTFTAEQNMVIVEKAIALRAARHRRRRHRRPAAGRRALRLHADRASTSSPRAPPGLGVTIHVGEEGGGTASTSSREVVESLRPDRIGHGILAARDPELMAALREAEITLEICPTSNLLTKALAGEDEVRETFRAFVEHGVAVHDRHRRPGDDADAPARRVRAAAAHRRARRGRGCAPRTRAGTRRRSSAPRAARCGRSPEYALRPIARGPTPP